MWVACLALAWADETFTLEGEVPDGGLDHVFVPFQVPEGVAEIEVHLDDLSDANILDWGLDDPAGHRGWGGGNTEPAVVGVLAASRSYVPGPLPAGTWNVVVGKAKIVEAPASYRITVTLRDAPTLAPQEARTPYVHAPALEVGERWYVGDFHVHSLESGDASASLDAIADRARLEGVDFVVITDHNVVTQADLLVDAQSRHPDVLFVPGIEVTTYQGHAGAIGATTWVDHRLGQPRGEGVVDVQSLADDVVAQGAWLDIHHPVLDLGNLCIGCAWDLDVPDGVGGVEIANSGWEPTGKLFTRPSIDFWEALCDQGMRLAPIGGSDDHRAGEGTGPFDTPVGTSATGVWATELSVPALLDALRAGRTQVLLEGPSSPRVTLTPAADQVRASVDGDGELLVWFVDGAEVRRDALEGEALNLPVDDPTSRVRVEIWVDDHPITVSAHVIPAEAEDPPSGPGPSEEKRCGCQSSPAAAVWPFALWLLWCRRRAECVSIRHRRPSHGSSLGWR